MYLIVGLGNPDKKYEKTFHNMGYIAVGDAAEQLGAKFKKKECEASVAEAFVGGEKVILARPLTYMNNSGRAVKQLMSKYKIDEDKLLVIYDDYDLPKGKVRIRANGSAGTHNGMRSIIGETGLKNFARIRIGIRDTEVDIPSSTTCLRKSAKKIIRCLRKRAKRQAKRLRNLPAGWILRR